MPTNVMDVQSFKKRTLWYILTSTNIAFESFTSSLKIILLLGPLMNFVLKYKLVTQSLSLMKGIRSIVSVCLTMRI